MGRIATIGSLPFFHCITIYRRKDGRTYQKTSVLKHAEVRQVGTCDWDQMGPEEKFDPGESVEVLRAPEE